MSLQGVLFDMGGTLLHYSPPGQSWEKMEKIGALGVYQHLISQNYELPPEPEALDFAWEYARTLWSSLNLHDVKTLNLNAQLEIIAGEWGVKGLAVDVLDALSLAYMKAIQAHVSPLDGAKEMLEVLQKRGLKLGLVSNTMWPGEHHRDDLDRYGLTSYFEYLIFSSDAEAWKPGAAVFQLALDALGLKAGDAAYVGDSLYFDVWGAQQAGLRSVWIEQEDRWLPDGIEDVIPDATITSLSELPGIVAGWQAEGAS